MSVELVVPQVGESITEVQIGRWLKNEGDVVKKDDPLVEIETDKVTLELPAPADGRVQKIATPEGEPASVGDVIGTFEEGQFNNGEAKSASAESAPAKPEPKTEKTPEPAKEKASGDEPQVMPAAQRLIDEHKLDAAQIKATGPGGRLLKEDVQNHLAQSTQTLPAPSAPASSGTAPAETPSSLPAGPREEQVVPMTPLRRKIAKALVNAQQTAALLTTFNEVNMAPVMQLRSRFKEDFLKKHNVKLGFMSFFTKAVVDALKQFPAVNAEVRGTDIVYKNYYDIGIAVGTGKGLVVPVLRNADALSFADVEKSINAYVEKIKANKLALEDLTGGTFTITNGGVFGSMLSTPIVNPPQSAVLGMHSIQERPMAVNGEVKILPIMYLALTYDHRLVDGREAVSFLKRIKESIEDPARMLMEV